MVTIYYINDFKHILRVNAQILFIDQEYFGNHYSTFICVSSLPLKHDFPIYVICVIFFIRICPLKVVSVLIFFRNFHNMNIISCT